MRMTNKIMENNSLYNINSNKILQDKLSTQMSTGKKLTRPSDDPVIAIRALRLRSDVSQISQFYEKNAPDAESWLKVTADALDTTTTVLTDMKQQCNKGSNKDLDYSQLKIIATQLESLKDEFYATGGVDFAGRTVFTGYRTDTTLTYTEDTTQDFEITEQITIDSVDTINYTNMDNLRGVNKENYDPVTDPSIDETTVVNSDIFRIRLSYDALKAGTVPTVEQVTDNTTVPPTTAALFPAGTTVSTMSTAAVPGPYDYIVANPDEVVLIPETGEMLLGKDVYDAIATVGADTEIRVSYEKNSWKEGDMRPQHYFACTDQTTGINYNFAKDDSTTPATQYISKDGVSQVIKYDVGYNQEIRINTTANEVYKLDLDRNIDDLKLALEQLEEISTSQTNLKNMLDGMSEGEAGYDDLKASVEAADKAYTYIRENVQKMFEGLNTKVEKTLDNTNVAITDNGTRSSRLDLVMNRLMTQKTTFKTLQSSNEDVDVTEATVQLTSMSNSYQSALMATSKIMQNTLMNYI